ncbi:MAG: pyridoxamine 5'-phosphate oxidase family protein [Planctomycetota bacterium JB042]
MSRRYLELLLTPSVLAAQRRAYGASRPVPPGAADDVLGPDEIAFVASRDSFYLASVSASGWPYVQHRGGATGFLRAVDPSTLAFADLRGNRQLLTAGNVTDDDRVSLFLMDYAGRRRLTLLGRATLLAPEDAPDLAALLVPESLASEVERVVRIHVVAFDWNCPKHITPRGDR